MPNSINHLICVFLDSLKNQVADSTFAWYAHYLESFRAFAGEQRAESLTPSIVYAWLARCYDKHTNSTRHAASRTVVRLMNWADDENILRPNPIRKFRKPAPSQREMMVSAQQYAFCVKQSHAPFRDVIKFCWHVGCRPQELRAIQTEWVNGRKIIFPTSNSKGTRFRKRKRRVLYLDGMARGITEKLARYYPSGHTFRNSNGRPWTKNGLSQMFRRLRRQTNIEGLCAYSFRHGFATRMLERGVDVATLAAIMGTSPRMILEIYQHVVQNEERLLSQLG